MGFKGESIGLSSSTVTTLSSELDEHNERLLGASWVSIKLKVRAKNLS